MGHSQAASDASERIEEWIKLELAPWRGVRLDRKQLAHDLGRHAIETPSLFLYRIDRGRVTFDTKAGEQGSEAGADALAFFQQRAELYRGFLQDALTANDVSGRGCMLMSLHDRTAVRFPLPIFAFQKRRGARSILLPDVDLINLDFFEGVRFQDNTPFAAKQDEAIFVGSTTGGSITRAVVEGHQNARLNAAMHFKGVPKVTFRLPGIVQCDCPETEQLVASLDIGGPYREWGEQTDCRYLLSIDGNGASCSRVALALLSQAVLAKYNSPNLLYYFHGLDPWIHYIPLIDDDDVTALMEQSPASIERDAAIAERSRLFAQEHLSRTMVMRYAAGLVGTYLQLFGDG